MRVWMAGHKFKTVANRFVPRYVKEVWTYFVTPSSRNVSGFFLFLFNRFFHLYFVSAIVFLSIGHQNTFFAPFYFTSSRLCSARCCTSTLPIYKPGLFSFWKILSVFLKENSRRKKATFSIPFFCYYDAYTTSLCPLPFALLSLLFVLFFCRFCVLLRRHCRFFFTFTLNLGGGRLACLRDRWAWLVEVSIFLSEKSEKIPDRLNKRKRHPIDLRRK